MPEDPNDDGSAELAALLGWFGPGGTGAEVLYLGDSVVERVSQSDTDRRTLGQMVADDLRVDVSTV